MTQAVKARRRRRIDPNEEERQQLMEFMAQTKVEINQAYAGFNCQSDPDLVESYVYEINALRSRYSYLVRRLKELEPVLLAVGGLALAALIVLRKPLAFLWRLLFRSGIGLCCLWLFNQAGALIGIQVGVNLVSALVVGVLGVPGFGLLLLTQWALR